MAESKQIVVKVPEDMYDRIARRAAEEDKTLSAWVREQLAKAAPPEQTSADWRMDFLPRFEVLPDQWGMFDGTIVLVEFGPPPGGDQPFTYEVRISDTYLIMRGAPSEADGRAAWLKAFVDWDVGPKYLGRLLKSGLFQDTEITVHSQTSPQNLPAPVPFQGRLRRKAPAKVWFAGPDWSQASGPIGLERSVYLEVFCREFDLVPNRFEFLCDTDTTPSREMRPSPGEKVVVEVDSEQGDMKRGFYLVRGLAIRQVAERLPVRFS